MWERERERRIKSGKKATTPVDDNKRWTMLNGETMRTARYYNNVEWGSLFLCVLSERKRLSMLWTDNIKKNLFQTQTLHKPYNHKYDAWASTRKINIWSRTYKWNKSDIFSSLVESLAIVFSTSTSSVSYLLEFDCDFSVNRQKRNMNAAFCWPEKREETREKTTYTICITTYFTVGGHTINGQITMTIRINECLILIFVCICFAFRFIHKFTLENINYQQIERFHFSLCTVFNLKYCLNAKW